MAEAVLFSRHGLECPRIVPHAPDKFESQGLCTSAKPLALTLRYVARQGLRKSESYNRIAEVVPQTPTEWGRPKNPEAGSSGTQARQETDAWYGRGRVHAGRRNNYIWLKVSLEEGGDMAMSELGGSITSPVDCQRNEDPRIRVRLAPKFQRHLLAKCRGCLTPRFPT